MGFYVFKGKRKHARRGKVAGKNPVRYYLNDVEVTQEEYDLAFPARPIPVGEDMLAGHQPSCWPQTMESLAVHPAQVDKANERAKKHGIDAVYERGTGMVQVGSRADRAKLIKLEGAKDKCGGYSDG